VPICIDLARAFEAGLSEYLEARSSACYQVSKRFAAKKKVDMERAKYALESTSVYASPPSECIHFCHKAACQRV